MRSVGIGDVMELRWGFQRLVYVRPTHHCPLRCRHCSAGSGPRSTRTAAARDLRAWVRSLGAAGPVRWLGFEGGEAFAARPQLRALLETAGEEGLRTVVLTSAYWATDLAAARRVLRGLPAPDYLIVSADEFHEEFVPLERIAHAARAALERVGGAAVQICRGPDHRAFAGRLRRALGVELVARLDRIEVPLQASGRARSLRAGLPSRRRVALPAGRCCFLGTPVVREDGRLVACCEQEVVLGRGPAPLHRGSLAESSARDLLRGIDQDPFLQLLRVGGPRHVALEARRLGLGFEPDPAGYLHLCELCRDLARRPGLAEAVRAAHAGPAAREELTLARLAVYGAADLPWEEA